MIRISIRKKLHMADGDGTLRIDAELTGQSFTALYGESGAGKTSLLKVLAGLMNPEEGIIEVNGETWLNTHKRINLPAQKRSIGFVFQDYALFPNMTVRENLQYASSHKKELEVIDNLITSVNMQNMADRKPATLSGGQKQRIALIRALVRKPQLLLLDEPLSALDHAMRITLQNELLNLHKQYGLTTLMVSHHLPEIYKMADVVWHLDKGELLSTAHPMAALALEMQDSVNLIGEILSIGSRGIEVMVENRLVLLPVNYDVLLQPGDRVALTCHAADITLKKL